MISDERLCYVIQLEGRYSWFDMFSHFSKCVRNKAVGTSHQFDLILSLEKNLHQVER